MSTNSKKIWFASMALVVLHFLGSLRTPELQIAPKQMAIKQSVQRNYVVFSTTLEEFARRSDYNYLPLVTALN
jgi:protein involved in ribonucleotide reduction